MDWYDLLFRFSAFFGYLYLAYWIGKVESAQRENHTLRNEIESIKYTMDELEDRLDRAGCY